MPAGSPQDRQASREPRRPLRWPRRVSAPCGMWSVQTLIRLQVAGRQAVFILTAYQNVACKKRVARTRTRSHSSARPYAAYLSPGSGWRRSWVGGAGGRGASGRQDADETRTKYSGEASRVLEEEPP